jgi:hypothetical protein
MTHPTFETLLNYVDGRISGDERTGIEAHLSLPCSRCQVRVQRIGEVLQLMAQDSTVTSPSPVLRRMLAAIRRLTPNRPRIPVQLVFDSWQHAPLAAMRGATTSQQLLFSAEGVDIDLQVSPDSNGATVRGQILSNSENVAQPAPFIVLQAGEDITASSETDKLGQFVFRSVPAGTYDLHIEFEQNQLAIEGLQIGK